MIPSGMSAEYRVNFIKSKYIGKDFLKKTSKSVTDLSESLYEIVRTENPTDLNQMSVMLTKILKLIAQGADPNFHNPLFEHRTSLHEAVMHDSVIVAEALMQSKGDPFSLDDRGWTPLHYTCHFDYVGCAKLLLKRGCARRVDKMVGLDGANPLDVANENSSFECRDLIEGTRSDSDFGVKMVDVENGWFGGTQQRKNGDKDLPEVTVTMKEKSKMLEERQRSLKDLLQIAPGTPMYLRKGSTEGIDVSSSPIFPISPIKSHTDAESRHSSVGSPSLSSELRSPGETEPFKKLHRRISINSLIPSSSFKSRGKSISDSSGVDGGDKLVTTVNPLMNYGSKAGKHTLKRKKSTTLTDNGVESEKQQNEDSSSGSDYRSDENSSQYSPNSSWSSSSFSLRENEDNLLNATYNNSIDNDIAFHGDLQSERPNGKGESKSNTKKDRD
eukprot:TRINITY_DN9039_c0_g1_i1.p1 TRINITY_DN9039_c0_g1~~TRINITY_DN9039_c0_g1_i1.p1  ORF type:complete len:443 (-),score=77.79 TRINITY_DN9039_c0_g1_i1:33-1361(-)